MQNCSSKNTSRNHLKFEWWPLYPKSPMFVRNFRICCIGFMLRWKGMLRGLNITMWRISMHYWLLIGDSGPYHRQLVPTYTHEINVYGVKSSVWDDFEVQKIQIPVFSINMSYRIKQYIIYLYFVCVCLVIIYKILSEGCNGVLITM